DELPLAADLHAFDALVQARDDEVGADDERQRIGAAAGAVEDDAVRRRARVLDLDLLALGRPVAGAALDVLDLPVARRLLRPRVRRPRDGRRLFGSRATVAAEEDGAGQSDE